MTGKVLILTVMIISTNAYWGGKCDDKEHYFRDDAHVCAIVFEDDGCKSDKMTLNDGYTKFNSALHNSVESLMVRPGCVLIGYSNNRGNNGSKYFEGDNAVFDALGRNNRDGPLVIDNLSDDELDNDMESADCYCKNTRNIGQVHQISYSKINGKGFFDDWFGRISVNGSCNDQVAVFNRPGKAEVKAMLFDEADCEGYMKELGTGYTSLTSVFGKNMENKAESIMVRPGCKLVGYDHTKKYIFGRGDSYTIDARKNNNDPEARNLDGKGELENMISSVDVEC